MKGNTDKGRHCCDRCTPLKGLYIGVLYVIGIVALIFALWAWSTSSFAYSWVAATQSGPFPTNYGTTLVVAPTVVTLTMPTILTSWIGLVFHVECISPLPHTVKIPGPYTWDGTNHRATCSATPSGPAGFTFIVTGQQSVRVLDSSQVTFTPI